VLGKRMPARLLLHSSLDLPVVEAAIGDLDPHPVTSVSAAIPPISAILESRSIITIFKS
jgi:hypothetical protein